MFLLFAFSTATVYAASFAIAPCSQCHADVSKVLGDRHFPVVAKHVDDCFVCHGGTAVTLSAALHKLHDDKIPCRTCHEIRDNNLTLRNSERSIGSVSEELFELYEELSAPSVRGAARLHQIKGVTCAGCHGTKTPQEGAVVNNARCESCHGSQEQISQRTMPTAKEQNPHASHQGKLPCSKCHAGHAQPKSYCLDCHVNFNQKMPEQSQ